MEYISKNENIPLIVGKQLKYLRSQVNLTIEGISFALSISISYVLMIERGEANISQKLAKKISDFFSIEIAQLYSIKQINLKQPLKINTIARFYRENIENAKFFANRRSEYSTANFIRTTLIKDSFMLEGRTIKEIRNYILQTEGRDIKSQELSRELRRLCEKKKLFRIPKFKNKSVYLYKRLVVE